MRSGSPVRGRRGAHVRHRAGAAYCWGDNCLGAIGDGSMGTIVTAPQRVTAPVPFASITGGQYFTCGVSVEKQGFCWGDNSMLQLGIGVPGSVGLPTRATFDTTFVLIRAGVRNACGITTAGQAVCWGDVSLGQTGGQAGRGSDSGLPLQRHHRR